jgi:hypothetical protein
MAVLQKISPYAVVAGLGLVFFAPLVAHPTKILYSDHSDLLAMHLPMKRFLVRSWQQTGEVPLWCPYSYGGMPLVHDVQVGAFYPFHLPLYLLPEESIGEALSWLVVIHVILAGWCMVAYARHHGLEGTALLVAAIGYMFAGKWLLHVLAGGHYILTPLAWLPLVLLLCERAIQHRSLPLTTLAGLVFALIVVSTHPQITLYAGLFVAFWTCPIADCRVQRAECGFLQVARQSAICNPESTISRGLMRWLALGSWMALVAAGASAIQLLPALEATSQASRAVGIPASDILQAGFTAVLGLVGPGWSEGWENRAGLGVLWLGAALLAPLLSPGRTRYHAAVAFGMALFALGGAALFQGLPGLRLFQIPVRMLLLLAVPVALFAGRTTQILLHSASDLPALRAFCRRVLLRTAAGGLLVSGIAAACEYRSWLLHETSLTPGAGSGLESVVPWLQQLPLSLVLYWPVALAALGVTAWLLGSNCCLSRPAWGCVWLALLLADLWALTWPHVAVRPQDLIYPGSTSAEFMVQARVAEPDAHWRVLDRGVPGEPSSNPLGSAVSMLGGVELEPMLGYNSFDVRRYKEYLQWLLDADEEIRPRSGLFGYPITNSFPIENKSLLDLLGVRFLIQPAGEHLTGRGEPGSDPDWRLVATDPDARVYSFLGAGISWLPPFAVYENRNYLPRAMLVPQAESIGERGRMLERMKGADFRQVVLLEDPVQQPETTPKWFTVRQSARIRSYQPNQVVVDTNCDSRAYLVMNDVWYPGWSCTVDGSPAPLRRANFLFRSVALPPGMHEIDFRFAPESYRLGQAVTVVTLLLSAALAFFLVARASSVSPLRAEYE